MKPKNYLKILEVPNWVTYKGWEHGFGKDPIKYMRESDKYYEEIPPRIGRDGFYYDRLLKQTWVEYEGFAFRYLKIEHFTYDFDLLNTKWLSKEEYNALVILDRARVLSKDLKRLLNINRDLNAHHRNRIYGLQAKKRFIEFKKARNL